MVVGQGSLDLFDLSATKSTNKLLSRPHHLFVDAKAL